MGPQRKLNFRERASCFRSCDRFSDLPDSIVHHIFSFVRPEDLVKVGILSRRFRQLFISSPYLFFRGKHDERINACTKRCKQLSSYVTDAFRISDGMKIYRFGLKLNCIDPNEALLNLWIQYALNCQVEEIDLVINLYFGDKNPYVLPRCIFKSSSLRDLRLSFRGQCSLKLEPENFDFSSLQVLSLSEVTLTDDYLGEWISTYCKSLRELKLCEVYGLKKLSIKSSSLEDLSISCCFSKLKSLAVSANKLQTLSINTGKVPWGSENRISMRIKAPSLGTLTWEGDLGVRFSRFSWNFNAIKSATVVDKIRDSTCDSIVEILQSVSQARVLNLHFSAIQDLFVNNRLPILFDHVHHLVVKGNSVRGCQISAIASFLRGLPNLRTLNVECISESSYCRESLEEPPSLLFSHLKEVEVEIVKNYTDLTLVKYLLKFAKRLEKMIVFCSGSFLEELAMNGVDVRSFETASSSVSLYFMHKKVDEDRYI